MPKSTEIPFSYNTSRMNAIDQEILGLFLNQRVYRTVQQLVLQ